MREKMNPGNWELRISGSGNNAVKLIDDSSGSAATVDQGGRVFNVVSGSIDGGTTIHKSAATPTQHGDFDAPHLTDFDEGGRAAAWF